MRNQVLYAVVAIATLFFVNGCVNPVVDPPTLKLDKTEVIAPADGGEVSVPFELANATEGSVVSVKPAEDYDWAEVTGLGESAITVTVARNETTESRTAEFAVSYPGISTDSKFSVTQLAGAAPVLTLDPSSVVVPAEGVSDASVSYAVANPVSDGAVSVKVPDGVDWVTAAVSEDALVINYSVAENNTTEERSAVLIVSYPGAVDAEFTVSQEAGAGPAYDYEFEMTSFTSSWFGDQCGNNGEHNYYTWISDMPFVDGYPQAGSNYYLFDIYAPAPSDEGTILIPEGTYTLGEFKATDEWTFSPDFSNAGHYNNEYELEWRLAFESGTLVVSYEGTTVTMDAVLTDTEGKTHHVTYVGDGVCANEAPMEPGFGEDVDVVAQSGSAAYCAPREDGASMEVILVFSDMDVDDEGYGIPPGTLLAVDAIMPFDADGNIAAGTYSVSEDRIDFTLYPGVDSFEGTGGAGVGGSYARHFNVSVEEDGFSLVTDGTMEITGGDGKYTIKCDFVGSDGYKITCSWSGEMTVSGMPNHNYISTLTGDYTLDLEGATAKAYYSGDYYETGGTNWVLQILPTDGPDGFIADFVSVTVSASEGIPSGTYKVSATGNPNPGEYLAGYVEDYALGGTMYVGGFTAEGSVSECAPATSGDMVITNNGDGTYDISLDFLDDRGYSWGGEWSGPIVVNDYTSYSYSMPSVDARHGGRMVEATISHGAKTIEQKAELLKENGFKIKTGLSATPKGRTSSFGELRK